MKEFEEKNKMGKDSTEKEEITQVGKLKRLVVLKLKFAATSSVATLVDYVLYLVLVNTIFSPVISNVVSYSCAMVINFIMQKRFIFSLQRTVSTAFVLSALVSLGGLAFSTLIIFLLNKVAFFQEYQFITKLCATGVVFFYNFYMKRYVFEKRFV